MIFNRITSHWTRAGTFEIVPFRTSPSNMDLCELRFRGKHIDNFNDPWSAAHAVASGGLDAELGISAADLSVPSKPQDWNNL